MRFLCSALTLLLLSCSSGAPEPDPSARRDFKKLEQALTAIEEAPESEWIDRLEQVEKLKVDDPQVVAVRDLCVSAYEAFGDATLRLTEARHRVAGVELLLQEGIKGDAGPQALSRLRKEALTATGDVTRSLDRAENLVAECVDRRRELRGTLTASH